METRLHDPSRDVIGPPPSSRANPDGADPRTSPGDASWRKHAAVPQAGVAVLPRQIAAGFAALVIGDFGFEFARGAMALQEVSLLSAPSGSGLRSSSLQVSEERFVAREFRSQTISATRLLSFSPACRGPGYERLLENTWPSSSSIPAGPNLCNQPATTLPRKQPPRAGKPFRSEVYFLLFFRI